MARPQQEELARSERTVLDPDSIASDLEARQRPDEKGRVGEIPEDNLPGHHPEKEQDKPDGGAFLAKMAGEDRPEGGEDAGEGGQTAGRGGQDAGQAGEAAPTATAEATPTGGATPSAGPSSTADPERAADQDAVASAPEATGTSPTAAEAGTAGPSPADPEQAARDQAELLAAAEATGTTPTAAEAGTAATPAAPARPATAAPSDEPSPQAGAEEGEWPAEPQLPGTGRPVELREGEEHPLVKLIALGPRMMRAGLEAFRRRL